MAKVNIFIAPFSAEALRNLGIFSFFDSIIFIKNPFYAVVIVEIPQSIEKLDDFHFEVLGFFTTTLIVVTFLFYIRN